MLLHVLSTVSAPTTMVPVSVQCSPGKLYHTQQICHLCMRETTASDSVVQIWGK